MTAWRYILVSLRQYRRVHLAVAAGVAVTTAVITGALLVGDSVRGSLRGLSLKSLGRVDVVLLAEHPFREALLKEWIAAPAVRQHLANVQPLIITQGSATFELNSDEVRRAGQLQVIGAPPEFWSLAAKRGPAPVVSGNTVALSPSVADELGVKTGDTVLLRVPLAQSVPSESTLGEKEETSAARRLKVSALLHENDDASLARFSLRPSQQPPRNVFVPLRTMQDLLGLDRAVNAAAASHVSPPTDGPLSRTEAYDIRNSLFPALTDFGIKFERLGADDPNQHRYVRISADRLVLPPHVAEAARELFRDDGLQPAVTYLANRIAAGERSIPYSTVTGVNSTAALGPLVDNSGNAILLKDDEVALNDWAADDLDVEVGDQITLTWYEPETTHGRLREAKPLALKVRAIVPLASRDGKPTLAADPNFAPELPGVTDQKSIDDWELPFELVETIRDKDEQYWEQHRTTPKAFISHALASKLWSSRWGTESVLRLPPVDRRRAQAMAETLREHLDPSQLGMALLPVKRDALDAAAGTTPFDGLFLGFSFFLMASAIMLTALLFRLGVEQRAREVGLLAAVGLPPRRLRGLHIKEAAIVAALGALVGVALGVGYARVMVYGLNTWWIDATATPFMELYATPRSLLIGFAAGLLVALATIAWSLRRFARLPARQLLAGDAQPPLAAKRASLFTGKALPLACIFASVALGFAATKFEGEAQAGAFLGAGALVLIGALLAVRGKLRESVLRRPARLTLAGLATRNARRNPSRTMLSLALSATASFLIVALSAFRLAPSDRGVGGFDLLASADLPLLYDLSTTEGRRELGFSEADNENLKTADIVGFRVHEGQDASCLNLYKPTQPRVLGASAALAESSQFQWANTLPVPSPWRGGLERGDDVANRSDNSDAFPRSALHRGERDANNWNLLNLDLGNDSSGRPIIPMVLDRNTAQYSLHLSKVGKQLVIQDGFGRPATLQIVGLLAGSVLQGDVIISEENFLRLFPEEAGQRFFLIRRGAKSPPVAELASLLETRLEDFGFDALDSRQRLGELLAVQNTYLSTFQSLGALGLLLGVVGLAVVQLRSVLERRGELALMQAGGFRRRRLARMVLSENLVLLIGGLGIGCLAALLAVLPHALVEQVGTPWGTLAVLLGIVALAGAAAAWLASRVVLRAPLLPALRGD
jgi:ABC-type antimicrobial peptide transport system permease subunit